jgi:hypothetical protein
MLVLSAWDLVALTIALTSSFIVVITTAVANHRLTESRDYWRTQYQELMTQYRLESDPTIWE